MICFSISVLLEYYYCKKDLENSSTPSIYSDFAEQYYFIYFSCLGLIVRKCQSAIYLWKDFNCDSVFLIHF